MNLVVPLTVKPVEPVKKYSIFCIPFHCIDSNNTSKNAKKNSQTIARENVKKY